MANCSYCGLKNDPRTSLGFASEWNLCHHATPAASPNLTHQEAFCLSDQHKSCPVFLLAEKKPLPKNVAFVGRQKPLRENTVFLRIGLAFFLLASALIGIVVVTINLYPANKVPRGTFTVHTTAAISSTPLSATTVVPTVAPTGSASLTANTCTPPAGWTQYSAAPSDTLERLHVFYGIGVAELESANCLADGYVLRSGDQIYVPPLVTITSDRANQSPTETNTKQATLTSSPRPIIYESPTKTKEENRPRPPTPVPPAKTTAPTNTSVPVVPTVPPVPTPTSPPPPASPPEPTTSPPTTSP